MSASEAVPSPPFLTSEEFFQRVDVVREYAGFDFLLPPERVILDELSSRLPALRMLDLGVGGGRTTLHFADRVLEYVGIDSSPAMIAACRRRFGDRLGPRRSFRVGDARDLSELPNDHFGLVLFAFQGLDSVVEHGERLTALREIRRVLAPGGTFAFSSDNLAFLRDTLSVRTFLAKAVRTADGGFDPAAFVRRPRRVVRGFSRLLRQRRLNRSLRREGAPYGRFVYLRPPHELSPAGYAEPHELIEIDGYAIEPSAQVAQLTAEGFRDVRVFAPSGRESTEGDRPLLRRSHWLYYVCRKGEDGPA